MKEKLIKWEPIKNLEKIYEIKDITFIDLDMTINLFSKKDKKFKMMIYFEGIVFAYRYVQLNLYKSFEKNVTSVKNNNCINTNWPFFKVLNSSYLKWLSEESCTLSDMHGLTHFIVMDTESSVEVLYAGDPEISFLQVDSLGEEKK